MNYMILKSLYILVDDVDTWTDPKLVGYTVAT